MLKKKYNSALSKDLKMTRTEHRGLKKKKKKSFQKLRHDFMLNFIRVKWWGSTPTHTSAHVKRFHSTVQWLKLCVTERKVVRSNPSIIKLPLLCPRATSWTFSCKSLWIKTVSHMIKKKSIWSVFDLKQPQYTFTKS